MNGERKRETSVWERNIDGLPPAGAPTGDGTCNPGMGSDLESIPQPFGVWYGASNLLYHLASAVSSLLRWNLEIDFAAFIFSNITI